MPDPERASADLGDESRPALTSRWWFWAGIAGAVLVGVVLTVVIAGSGDAEPEPVDEPPSSLDPSSPLGPGVGAA